MAIGVFDSGVGGLNLFSRLRLSMPKVDLHYYADRDHVPYSYHSPDEILSYVKEAEAFLRAQGCALLLLACNTATSVAAQYLRMHSPLTIIGMEPAIKPAYTYVQEKGGRVLVAATPVTLSQPKLKKLLEELHAETEVDLCPLPGLVERAEQGDFNMQEAASYLKDMLAHKRLEDYSAVVLGCTHFSYFKEAFQQIFTCPVAYFDGYDGTVQQVIKYHHQVEEEGQSFFWESGRATKEEAYKKWLERTL